MSWLDWGNLGATLLTFSSFSFLVTSFGTKLGRISGFKNNTGYRYISDMNKEKSDALYDEVVKVAKKEEGAPSWAKDKAQLKDRCKRYQYSLKYWSETVKYCVIQNTVRHKLAEDGIKLKTPKEAGEGAEPPAPADPCTENLLNARADDRDSYYYLLGKKHCKLDETASGGVAGVGAVPGT